MTFFIKIWRSLLQFIYRPKYRLTLTAVMELQENELTYRILDNGHDYEVEIRKYDQLFYHNTGFSNFQDALSFVEFFRSNLPKEE